MRRIAKKSVCLPRPVAFVQESPYNNRDLHKGGRSFSAWFLSTPTASGQARLFRCGFIFPPSCLNAPFSSAKAIGQAFINQGSLNARPAGMEPRAGMLRQPAILGADPVFADRMRAAVWPKQPAGRSGAQRNASMEARTAPRRPSKSLIRATQQNAKFAHSAAAPDTAPNGAACERSAAFISTQPTLSFPQFFRLLGRVFSGREIGAARRFSFRARHEQAHVFRQFSFDCFLIGKVCEKC